MCITVPRNICSLCSQSSVMCMPLSCACASISTHGVRGSTTTKQASLPLSVSVCRKSIEMTVPAIMTKLILWLSPAEYHHRIPPPNTLSPNTLRPNTSTEYPPSEYPLSECLHRILPNTPEYPRIPPHTPAYPRIPPHTPAYPRIPPHTPAYQNVVIWGA